MRERASFRAVALAPFLALFLGGCELTIDDDPWHQDGLHGAIRETAAEINLHYAILRGTPGMAEARLELDRHHDAMEARTGGLRGHMLTMRCDPGGRDGMVGLMTSVELRVERYVDDARAALTVPEMLELCVAYGDDMEALFDRIHDHADRMDCYDDF